MTQILFLVLLLTFFTSMSSLAIAQIDSELLAPSSPLPTIGVVEKENPLATGDGQFATDLPEGIIDAAREAGISLHEEGSTASLDVDFSSIEQALISEFKRNYIDDSCGDRMQTESMVLKTLEGRLDVEAEVSLMRYMCAETPRLVYTGFVPEIETTVARAVVFSKSFPVMFQLAPQVAEGGAAVTYWISADYDGPAEDELIGRWESYEEIRREMSDAVLEATQLAWEAAIGKAYQLSEGEGFVYNNVTFGRGVNGTLILTAGLKE